MQAVLQQEDDACADAAAALSAETPDRAVERWLQQYTGFVATKQGLAAALHSGDPAFGGLPVYFVQRLEPLLGKLLAAAAAAGELRGDVGARELLHAVAQLCIPVPNEEPGHSQRTVALLLDGLRYDAGQQSSPQ